MADLDIKALRVALRSWGRQLVDTEISALLDAYEERDALRGRVEWWPMWEALRDTTAERDAARTWARWMRQHGSWPVVGQVLYRLTEFDALDWAAEEDG